MITIARSVQLDFIVLTRLFTLPHTGAAWVIPIAMILGAQKSIWKHLNNTFLLHTCIGAGACAISVMSFAVGNDGALDWLSSTKFTNTPVVYPAGFLLMTWEYQGRPGRIMAIVGISFWVIMAVLTEGRLHLLTVLLFVMCFIMMLLSKRENIHKKMGVFLVVILLAAIVVPLALNMISSNEAISGRIETFADHMSDDSRLPVWTEFLTQMSVEDVIIGRGALSRYDTTIWLDREPGGRDNVESGYLQLIFKGGSIMLVLFLLLAFPAGMLGLFAAKNWFSRAAGIIVIIRLICMLIRDIPWADTSYVLFWIAVGVCYNRKLRQSSKIDETIFS